MKWNCCVFVSWFCCWGDETDHVCWFMLSFFYFRWDEEEEHPHVITIGDEVLPGVLPCHSVPVSSISILATLLLCQGKKLRFRWKIIDPNIATGAHRVSESGKEKKRKRDKYQRAQSGCCSIGYCCKALVTQHVHRKCRSN